MIRKFLSGAGFLSSNKTYDCGADLDHDSEPGIIERNYYYSR